MDVGKESHPFEEVSLFFVLFPFWFHFACFILIRIMQFRKEFFAALNSIFIPTRPAPVSSSSSRRGEGQDRE
jgi:hypothetical protein